MDPISQNEPRVPDSPVLSALASISEEELLTYLRERYFEQLVPITYAEDEAIYYDVIVE